MIGWGSIRERFRDDEPTHEDDSADDATVVDPVGEDPEEDGEKAPITICEHVANTVAVNGGKLSQGDLADALGWSSGKASTILCVVDEYGWIDREAPSGPQKVVTVPDHITTDASDGAVLEQDTEPDVDEEEDGTDPDEDEPDVGSADSDEGEEEDDEPETESSHGSKTETLRQDVLGTLEDEGGEMVFGDLAKSLDCGSHRAYVILAEMTRDGAVERVRRGAIVYVTLPDNETDDSSSSKVPLEERILTVLEENDGKIKQADLPALTDSSPSLVSTALGPMATNGVVTKTRVGRGNIIELPDDEEDEDAGADEEAEDEDQAEGRDVDPEPAPEPDVSGEKPEQDDINSVPTVNTTECDMVRVRQLLPSNAGVMDVVDLCRQSQSTLGVARGLQMSREQTEDLLHELGLEGCVALSVDSADESNRGESA